VKNAGGTFMDKETEKRNDRRDRIHEIIRKLEFELKQNNREFRIILEDKNILQETRDEKLANLQESSNKNYKMICELKDLMSKIYE